MARGAGACRAEGHGRRRGQSPRADGLAACERRDGAVTRTIVFGVLGFVLGLGGATAGLVLRGADAEPKASDAAADSAVVADSAAVADSVAAADSAASGAAVATDSIGAAAAQERDGVARGAEASSDAGRAQAAAGTGTPAASTGPPAGAGQ